MGFLWFVIIVAAVMAGLIVVLVRRGNPEDTSGSHEPTAHRDVLRGKGDAAGGL